MKTVLKRFLSISLFLGIISFSFFPAINQGYVYAQTQGQISASQLQIKPGETCSKYDAREITDAGLMTGVTASCYACGTCDFCDILTVLITISDFILKTFGLLAAVFFVYGAGWLMLSNGNDEYIKKGKSAIRASIVGSIIILFSFQITSLIMLLLVNQNIFTEQQSISGSELIRGWYSVAEKCKNRPKSSN